MTDEEMAEAYIKSNNLEWELECHRTSPIGEIKQAFLAGLNAKLQWHKVTDDDLPDNCRYVWTNIGAGYHDNDGWWDDFGMLRGVIAWCEPKFEQA